MMTTMTYFALAVLLQTDFNQQWPSIVARLQRGDAELQAAGVSCQGLIAQKPAPTQAALAHYCVAYVNYRLANSTARPARERLQLLREGESEAGRAIDANPRWAEAYGLLSTIYGNRIGLQPAEAAALSSSSREAMSKATAIEPNNPRLLLSQAISAFHTPPEFGGSMEQAEALLRKSIAAFAQEPEDRPWPNWGRFDAHAWLGQVFAQRGDKGAARAEYDRALKYAPESVWIKQVLIPQLGK